MVQKTRKVSLFSDKLAAFTFWLVSVIVAAVITLPLGLTSTKEYAELMANWYPHSIVWIAYLVFFGTGHS